MTATNAPSFATELRAEQKAHEPSMEDILASIRRMIADDDVLPLSRRARAAARSQVVTQEVVTLDIAEPDAPAAAQKAPADAFLSLVHRLGGENTPDVLPPSAPVPEADIAAAPAPVPELAPAPIFPRTPTLKLRDFALKNFMARPAPLQEPPLQEPPAQETAAQDSPTVEPEPASALLATDDLRSSPGEAETRAASLVEPVLASSVVMLSPRPSNAAEIRLKIAPLTFRAPAFAASSAPPVALAPVPEPVAEKAPTPAQPAPQEPAPQESVLLSSASDAKIGASFEALAESLLARDKDLVERAARDLLRPMLKTWLDDHLPSLVERLVRAEIERVARGRG